MSLCTIRLYEDRDAPEVYAAVRESLAEVGVWMAWCHPNYSLEEVRAWIATQQDLVRDGLAYEFAIIGGNCRFLGSCGINQINKANRFANLGYWVRTSATGQGIAPSAASLLISYAFQHTDLVRLEIVCAVGNVRSQRVADKLGAVREGVLRRRLNLPSGPSDAAMYSVVRIP